MEALQLDNTNNFAVEALKVLIASLRKDRLTPAETANLAALSKWKGQYEADDTNAELYQLWWNNVREYTWDEFSGYPYPSKRPDDAVLLDLLQHAPADIYFDKQGTPPVEHAADIIEQAFKTANPDYEKKVERNAARWDSINRLQMMHLSNIREFGKTDIPSDGYPDVVNAKYINWGPSWRMVVEMGERPVAYGIYAGGQSGHVGSPWYDNFISDWNKGKYYPLLFFLSKEEAMQQAGATWLLK
jgi:penicillin amidase